MQFSFQSGNDLYNRDQLNLGEYHPFKEKNVLRRNMFDVSLVLKLLCSPSYQLSIKPNPTSDAPLLAESDYLLAI